MQWQMSHDISRVVTQTTRLLQLADRRMDCHSPWKSTVSGLLAERVHKRAAEDAHLDRALCHLQVLQALLTDRHAFLERRLLQVGVSRKTAVLVPYAK